jgi:hypothetical protein
MSKSTQQRAELHPEGFSGELRLIPLWSVAGAVVAFTLMEYLMWVVVAAHRHHPPNLPFGFRFYVNISIGALAGLYVLMIGYISRDSPRRGMSVPLWMVVCVVIPSGIGAVLYFLLRLPVLSLCPACNVRSVPTRWRPAAATAIAPRASPICTACIAGITWLPITLQRGCTPSRSSFLRTSRCSRFSLLSR